MTTKIGINGMGRIGRLVLRMMMEEPELEVVAANDIAALDNLAYLMKHDSVHVDPKNRVEAVGDVLHWDDRQVKYFSEKDPANLPWGQMGVQIVIESTGRFSDRQGAEKHLQAGAQRVIITADAKGADATFCMGVNETSFDPAKDFIVSNASCTTNALAPVAKVLDENFGIHTAFLTTVHAYTSTQALVDKPEPKEWRRGRAAAVSIVPTSTGATRATAKVLPQLKDKMWGIAVRVPVASGSLLDLVVMVSKPVTVEEVNEAFRRASESPEMKGILGVTDDPLVSADIVGYNYSSLVDCPSTTVLSEQCIKVLSWYDNEWGYSRRVVDLAKYISKRVWGQS